MEKNLLLSTIFLARKNLGKTAPNPVVGAIITKDNKIISSGVTSFGGRPHAEQIAINNVKNQEDLSNSTLYVSLEPCCHYGQTPPCADLIIKSKIKKVVIASIDNNPKVNKKGIEKLENEGVEVILSEIPEAYELNRGFFKAQETKTPFVTLKLATSKNNKISGKNGERIWISNEKSRSYSHYLRSINDGILIGSNTLKNDNPILNCRLGGLKNFSPKRFILSANFDFDDNYKIFENCDEIPTFIITSKKFQNKNLDNFLKKSVKFIFCDEKNDEIDLNEVLKEINKCEVNSLLVEGGNKIATNFLNQNLVDEMILIKSQKEIQDGISINFDKKISKFKLTKKKKSGKDDVIEIYRI